MVLYIGKAIIKVIMRKGNTIMIDFTNEHSLHSGILNAQRATEKRNEILRRKLKTSQQKCRRLQRKITFLALLIKHLQKKKLAQNK